MCDLYVSLHDLLYNCCCVGQGHVVMGTQAVSTYQQVIEKTKGLAFRSQMLVMNIEKKLAPKQEVMTSKLSLCTFQVVLHRINVLSITPEIPQVRSHAGTP